MLKLYIMVALIAVLGAVGYGAKYYYDTTQATIGTLRENNAQLEVAVQTANESVESLQQDMVKLGELNNKLQGDLQKAEAYGDNLRNKLRQMDLVADAIRDAENLEGRMNGATAKIWRELERDTGGAGDKPLPNWLQPPSTRTTDQGGDEGGEDADSSGSQTETDTTN